MSIAENLGVLSFLFATAKLQKDKFPDELVAVEFS